MTDDPSLLDAVQQVYIAANNLAGDDIQDAWITRVGDEELSNGEKEVRTGSRSQPRKREVQSDEELKAELEKEFLNPSPRFSTPWLNKLQQYVPFPQDKCSNAKADEFNLGDGKFL